MSQSSVIIVGGGAMGLSAAYWLTQKGHSVTVLDRGEIPNSVSASGDHLRAFRLTYGKDAFYTEMASRALPLWLQLNIQSGEKLLVQNGILELATVTHGYEEQSLKVLKELKIRAEVLDKNEVRKRYPMVNTRAIKYALLHPDGGMIWARKAVLAISSLAQRKGVKMKPRTPVTAVLRDKSAVKGVRDESGKIWKGDWYLFACGCWSVELLKPWRLPLKITRQQQLYLRPPINRGRYRPEHFPVFAALSRGFYGFPLHIHGFLKIADHRPGPVGRPPSGGAEEISPSFERNCRQFLKRHMPELASFTESEGAVCYYDNTKDKDFILDRLPGAANAYVACGFSGHGFKFAPLIGKSMAELMAGEKPELNMQRFRLGRFGPKFA